MWSSTQRADGRIIAAFTIKENRNSSNTTATQSAENLPLERVVGRKGPIPKVVYGGPRSQALMQILGTLEPFSVCS